MRRTFGKKDALFIGGLFLVCLLALLLWHMGSGKAGARIVVTRDGDVYGTYALSEDQTIAIKDTEGNVTNTLVIRDGKADMTDADCPDKLCVHQKAISAQNETIVCLPNRVVVTVTQAEKEGMDGFAQ